jgi:NADPH:quinone reductase-like Zn-dependent oxidoreductase
MHQTGLLVESWPIVLGCDASGIAIECGSPDSKFNHVDGTPQGVFGCTRLGFPGYSTFQEYFLMDEHLAFKRPSDWGGDAPEKGATVGVGLLVSALTLLQWEGDSREGRVENGADSYYFRRRP